MAYAILRTKKYKTPKSISGLVGHHLRVPGPELVGMLDFLSEREDARNLLALLKVDPAMGEMVRQNIELAVGMGSQLQAADWTTASKGRDWGRVLQFAVEGQETAGRSPFN